MQLSLIPANAVAQGYGVPRICARHGEPAAYHRRVRLVSRPPVWAAPLILFGALPYVIVVMVTRKTVFAPAWPFCARCRSRRGRLLFWGFGGLLVGLVMIVLGAEVGSGAGGALILLGFLLMLVGVITAALAGAASLARAQVSRDGRWVEVRRAEARFAQAVNPALRQPGAGRGVPPVYR